MKFLKDKKVVILLAGRYAGKKAVILKYFDDGTSSRSYGHASVCILAKEPRKVIKKQSQKKQNKRSFLKTTVKTVNYQHLMPTRYSLDVDLKTVFTNDAYGSRENLRGACLEANKILTEKFKSGKNRWFFTKLRF
ncbi:hypothetical protein WJX73_002675 [Symbiochloris irregularis]|uniref:60S ribosomal protein L27 n=1 Tax=Symbiochloris irregularis TaxID=706552 RepID=A0AAW1NW90_9CHLO